MLDRNACERRVYRLATLLTGNPTAATHVMARVVDAQPDLRNLDGAHLDRLAVLCSREARSGVLTIDGIPTAATEALAALSPQQREAWVFARIYRLSDRELAKAMDCSVSATQRHLQHADITMNRIQAISPHDLSARLLEHSMSIDVPSFYRAQRQRRAHTLRIIRVAALAALVMLLAAIVLWWTRPLSSG